MLPNQLPTGYPWWSESALKQGLREHENVEDLSEAWGCAASTLYNWIDKHGIDPEAV